MKSTKYQLLEDDFRQAKKQLGEYHKRIKELEDLNKKHYHALINVCSYAEKYEKALNEIDTHIRATPEPIPYIVETLKNTLPYYKVENYK